MSDRADQSLYLLRCLTCDGPIGTYKLGEAKSVMKRCSRCGTLQHRHVE